MLLPPPKNNLGSFKKSDLARIDFNSETDVTTAKKAALQSILKVLYAFSEWFLNICMSKDTGFTDRCRIRLKR